MFLDLDGVLDSTGGLKPFPWASKILSTVEGRAFIEKSATGTGIHAICRGSLPEGRRQFDMPGVDHTGFAFYDKSRFFTFTGSVLPRSSAIQDLTPELESLRRDLFPSRAASHGKHGSGSLNISDSELLERARRSKNGHRFSRLWDGDWQDQYPSQSEADLALCCHLAFGTGRDAARIDSLFRQSGLHRPDKWERVDYRERTIGAAIKQATETYEPNSFRGACGGGNNSRGTHSLGASSRGKEPPDLLHGYDPQDVGNGQRFRSMYGDIVRWCPEIKKYLVRDSRRWKTDDDDRVRVLAQEVMTEFGIQAMKAGHESSAKFAAGCRRSSRITNALREAQPHLAIHANELDTNPWLLNFQNGTLDLRTGELLDHCVDHYITRIIEHDYDPAATSPQFLRFLERITGGGPDAAEAATTRSERLMLFLQRAFGYSLTGVTSEKVVFLLYGPHDNGKSTLLALFLKLLGPYAVLLQIESLIARPQESNNAQADLADLNGARFVMTSETEEGQRLAEGKLKRITQGTGRIKAARKFENPIEFNESHKLWLDCNFLPVLRGHDKAIWRRLRTIPFNVVIPPEEQDRNLSAKLLKEAEGILAWAVQGALDWQKYGLPETPEVDDVGRDWKCKADQIGRFMDNCCTTVRTARVSARALYAAYRKWAEEAGEKAEPENTFSDRMQERGFQKERKEQGVVYFGIGLVAD